MENISTVEIFRRTMSYLDVKISNKQCCAYICSLGRLVFEREKLLQFVSQSTYEAKQNYRKANVSNCKPLPDIYRIFKENSRK